MQSSLLDAVNAYIASQGGGFGLFPTPIAGFNIIRSDQAMMPMRSLYRPSLCVVLQGAKEIHVGETRLDYGAMQCLVVSVDVPATGRIVEASPSRPYVGITLDFDVATLRSVLELIKEPPAQSDEEGPCIFVGLVDDPLAGCMLRLLRMLEQPQAIPVLYPSVMREVCYWLLSGPHGGDVSKLALPDSSIERVVRAISLLHTSFADPLPVARLADVARMSPSSFHRHFKALTSMTPLQFQKQLRLLEARRLMASEAANVTEAAFRVGYESASQFSREYSRTFGVPPKQDAMNQQKLYREYASRTVSAAANLATT